MIYVCMYVYMYVCMYVYIIVYCNPRQRAIYVPSTAAISFIATMLQEPYKPFIRLSRLFRRSAGEAAIAFLRIRTQVFGGAIKQDGSAGSGGMGRRDHNGS